MYLRIFFCNVLYDWPLFSLMSAMTAGLFSAMLNYPPFLCSPCVILEFFSFVFLQLFMLVLHSYPRTFLVLVYS